MADLSGNANQNKKKKKSGLGIGWLIFVVIIMLSNLMENADGSAVSSSFRHLIFRLRIFAMQLGVPFEVLLLAPVVLIVLIIIAVSAAKKRASAAREDRPTSARTSAAVRRPDPRTKSFTEPDAYCFSCEASGEDHFQRDKSTRIRQLDDWLKNGLIDREEYKVLKARYEQDL